MRELLTPIILIPLLAMFAVQTITSMADLTVPVLAPAAADDIGVAAALIGAWMALLYISAMLSGLMTGSAVARWGAVRVCQVALALAAAGLVAFALAHPLLALASAVCLGSAYGTVNPASSDVLARHTPPRWRPLIFSIKQSGVTLGGVLAGAAAPICAELWGWNGAALALAVIIVALAALLHPTRTALDGAHLAGDTVPRRVSILRPLRLILGSRTLATLTVAAFLFSGIQVCLFSFFVLYMTEGLGLSLVVAGLAYAALQSGGVIGRLLWGIVADGLLSSRHLLMLLGGMSALGLITISGFDANWSRLPIFLVSGLLGASAFGWNAIYLSEVARLAPPGQIGEATGGAQFFFFAGAMAMPPAFGAMASLLGGYSPAFLGTAILALLASLAVALAHAREIG